MLFFGPMTAPTRALRPRKCQNQFKLVCKTSPTTPPTTPSFPRPACSIASTQFVCPARHWELECQTFSFQCTPGRRSCRRCRWRWQRCCQSHSHNHKHSQSQARPRVRAGAGARTSCFCIDIKWNNLRWLCISCSQQQAEAEANEQQTAGWGMLERRRGARGTGVPG